MLRAEAPESLGASSSNRARAVLAVALAALAAFGAFLLLAWVLERSPVARATDGPGFCGICHPMSQATVSYLNSAHSGQASCNSCHLPRGMLDGAAGKVYEGLRDFAKFTLGLTPEPPEATTWTLETARMNCLACHSNVMANPTVPWTDPRAYDCLRCHRRTPHGE
ncbi:MAG: hypothetical protein C4551_02825 [Bacillota bacterium]|nr:MAG: hypothetical protein C4551_02825 [Bacillota bacterium]